MPGYGQFCPIAKAAEILSERWTLLILRDLLHGSRHFNELRRGVPRMSPTLLTKRLQMLVEHGIITRERVEGSQGCEYRLTRAGRELKPLIRFVGEWGQRWVRSTLSRDELDPGALMWFIHRHFQRENLPARRIVMYIEITDVKRLRHWWLVIDNGDVDLCLEDPGHEIDLMLATDLLSLTRVYIGDRTIGDAIASGAIRVEGPRALTRTLPQWFARSKFADIEPGVRDNHPSDASRKSASDDPPDWLVVSRH